MGILVPEHFDLKSLANDAERLVVEALCDQLNDGWIVMPSVQLARKNRDYEIDVVLVHRDLGVAVIEVKGNRPEIRKGVWFSHGEPMSPQPVKQVRDHSGVVRDTLKEQFPVEFRHLHVPYAIALPNCSALHGDPPKDVRPHELWWASTFGKVADAVERLFLESPVTTRFPEDLQRLVVESLLPSSSFSFNPGDVFDRNRRRLETICTAAVRTLERLDANRRVVVTGGAGTGKTRLALAWARRALTREERVLLTCFNEPLADQMRHFLGSMSEDENLTVGPFLRISRELKGMPELDVPEFSDYTEETDFWNVTMVSHLHNNWPRIECRFDTIIIDEAQDFSPAWVAQLESLLDPDGPRRVMMVGDTAQDVFDRGFSLPVAADGWTIGELTHNCRNTYGIAQLLRRMLGGAISPHEGPESHGINLIEVPPENAEVIAAVRTLIEAHDGGRVAVIANSHVWRDQIRRECGLRGWEGHGSRTVCETPRRMKGTEFDFVIVVDPDGRMDDQALYISISRAVSKLAIVGPKHLTDRFQSHAT